MRTKEFIEDLNPSAPLIREEYDFQKRYESFVRMAKIICPEFTIDSKSKPVYEDACRYFAADPECTWDLNKGLYVYCDTGVGKTEFFKIFNRLLKAPGITNRNNFKVFTINDIIDGYSAKGPMFWQSSNMNVIPSSQYHYLNPVHIFVDDIGQNYRTVYYMGTKTDVVCELIQRRYYAFTENRVLTHFTSNIKPSEIKEIYGSFCASRMKAMFNIILLPGTDKRK